jgi:hypothetical protein
MPEQPELSGHDVNRAITSRMAEHYLGHQAAMISYSKSGYRKEHPEHAVVFNSNVIIAGKKVWYGDFDLTIDEVKLVTLAQQLGEIVYLLYERDARFQYEDDPQVDRAIYSVTPTGHTKYGGQSGAEHYERRADGAIYRRPRPKPARFQRPRRPHLRQFWQVETDHSTSDRRSNHRITFGRNRFVGDDDGGWGKYPFLIISVGSDDEYHGAHRNGRITWWPGSAKQIAPGLRLSRELTFGR